MRLWGQTAFAWEFRWKVPILFASQPLLAFCAWLGSTHETPWYAPKFSVTTGWIAAAIGAVGVLWRLQSTATLQAHIMASRRPDASRFVTTGIYGAVRNPLYLASSLLFGGYALFFGWPWALGFVLLHWLRYDRIVRLEEAHLREQWQRDFENYCRDVPRWFPKLKQLLFGSWVRISFDDVLANFVFVSIGLGILVSAIFRDLTWMIPIELAGGAVMGIRGWLRSSKMRSLSS